ncbi:hypothetical protein CK203_041329 [Vitis vinifera]|uniref:Uncharacterized protein n=1 Tax=Vitis vinifera TaxID=29760 RepID=A0A438H642_VITVI|nr:hypothetical protein CK203_041329 [Vitis vinifera]
MISNVQIVEKLHYYVKNGDTKFEALCSSLHFFLSKLEFSSTWLIER